MTLKEVLSTISVKRDINICEYGNAVGHVISIWSGKKDDASPNDLNDYLSREVCSLIPYIERSNNGRWDDKPVLMIYLLDDMLL